MKNNRLKLIVALLLLAVSGLSVGGCDYITGKAMEYSMPIQTQEQAIKNVSPTEAYAVMALNEGHANFTIIDVRTPAEYDAGHIPGAIIRDYRSATFRDDIAKLDRNKIYLVYCASGNRSASARDVMQELGFQQIYNMNGGFTAWTAQGLPVVK
jgi:rhodanese-related sulfurtransferase